MKDNCIFCKIISGEIPSKLIYEDDVCVAFEDINPQAPTHILIIPKEHIDSLNDIEDKHKELLGKIMIKLSEIAADCGISEKGYRVVVNTNEHGGQTVFHLHMHLLGGRQFTFPPG